MFQHLVMTETDLYTGTKILLYFIMETVSVKLTVKSGGWKLGLVVADCLVMETEV